MQNKSQKTTQLRQAVFGVQSRAREVPAMLRSLSRFEDGAESAQALCDELLADADALLALCIAREVPAVAEQLIQLKWWVYAVLRPFLRAAGWSGGALRAFERSAMVDLEDSQRRIERVYQRAETVQMLHAGAA